MGDCDLLQRWPEATTARDFDDEIINQSIGCVMKKISRADAGFVDGQGQWTLLAQTSHKLQLVRRKWLLQHVHTNASEAARDHQRFVRPKALVRVRPDKGVGTSRLADYSGQGDLAFGRDGNFEVKMPKAFLPGSLDFSTHRFFRAFNQRIAERDGLTFATTAQIAA